MFVEPPHRSIIIGASRLAGVLSSAGLDRAVDVVKAIPRYGDMTPSQYSLALDWLMSDPDLVYRLSLLDGVDEINRFFFEEYAINSKWINSADLIYKGPEDLPTAALDLADGLSIEPGLALDLVRGAHYRINRERLAEIGLMGEIAILELLESKGLNCRQVSLVSDTFGYDIEAMEPSTGSIAHLEVKASTNFSRSSFFLSRNELEVSLKDESWMLVYLQIGEAGNLVYIGTVDSDWIHDSRPLDRSVDVTWESARFCVDPLALEPAIRVGNVSIELT